MPPIQVPALSLPGVVENLMRQWNCGGRVGATLND